MLSLIVSASTLLVISCELDLDHIKVLIIHTHELTHTYIPLMVMLMLMLMLSLQLTDCPAGCEVFFFCGIKVSLLYFLLFLSDVAVVVVVKVLSLALRWQNLVSK